MIAQTPKSWGSSFSNDLHLSVSEAAQEPNVLIGGDVLKVLRTCPRPDAQSCRVVSHGRHSHFRRRRSQNSSIVCESGLDRGDRSLKVVLSYFQRKVHSPALAERIVVNLRAPHL